MSYEIEKQVLETQQELAVERGKFDEIMLEQADEMYLNGKIQEKQYKELSDKYSTKLAKLKAKQNQNS
ncbi:MAG: hypothetical protein ACXADW_16825 [Candidatus Hodarchaeales archaeon]|jgi:hypothetical protein